MIPRENPAFDEERETLLDEEIVSSDEILDFINDEVEKKKEDFKKREEEREREGKSDIDATEKEAIELADSIFSVRKAKSPKVLEKMHAIVNERAKKNQKYMSKNLAAKKALESVVKDLFGLFEERVVMNTVKNREKNIPEALGEEEGEEKEELQTGKETNEQDETVKAQVERIQRVMGKIIDMVRAKKSRALKISDEKLSAREYIREYDVVKKDIFSGIKKLQDQLNIFIDLMRKNGNGRKIHFLMSNFSPALVNLEKEVQGFFVEVLPKMEENVKSYGKNNLREYVRNPINDILLAVKTSIQSGRKSGKVQPAWDKKKNKREEMLERAGMGR